MSTVTHFNPDSIYGFDSASTGSVLTKGSSSSITFQNISAIVPSNVSSFTNDAGYINSAVTSMTNYATSADVVNRLNIVNNELPMSVYLFVNSSDGTAESYRDINGSEPISVREIVEYLNSGRTIEFYSRPIPWAGGQTPYTRLDNVMFGVGYNTPPSSGRTYRIYGEAFNYANNKQYNFEAIDSTQDANPNYTWSAAITTSKSDYATKIYVDDSIMSIDDTIYISGTGTGQNVSTYSISRTNDELYNLIVSSNTRINAVLMFKETSGSPIVPMLCKSYQKSVTNNGDDVSITLDFISTLAANSSYTLLTEYTVQVILELTKIYDGNYNFIGYGSSITVFGITRSVGGIVSEPGYASTGQLVAVSSAGTYEVTPIFTYTPNSVATASNVSINFNSFRNSQMITISGNTNFIFNVDNQADNILWVYNSGPTDITFGISGVTYYGDNVTMFGFPKDWLTFVSGQMAEIGLICDDDGAKFTWRDDLSWTSTLPS